MGVKLQPGVTTFTHRQVFVVGQDDLVRFLAKLLNFLDDGHSHNVGAVDADEVFWV